MVKESIVTLLVGFGFTGAIVGYSMFMAWLFDNIITKLSKTGEITISVIGFSVILWLAIIKIYEE